MKLPHVRAACALPGRIAQAAHNILLPAGVCDIAQRLIATRGSRVLTTRCGALAKHGLYVCMMPVCAVSVVATMPHKEMSQRRCTLQRSEPPHARPATRIRACMGTHAWALMQWYLCMGNHASDLAQLPQQHRGESHG